MNCPTVPDDPPPRLTSPLRTSLGLGGRPILLHHGRLTDGRGIMETFRALDFLHPDVALVLLGDGDLVPAIRAASEGSAGRLFHRGAVSLDELPRWVAGADVGVIAFQAIERNNVLATPNKLFECLAVGVPVVVSDFPEMRRVVDEFGVGATCDPARPESIATAIRGVLEQNREAWFDACRTASTTRFSWQRQSQILVDAYDALTERER